MRRWTQNGSGKSWSHIKEVKTTALRHILSSISAIVIGQSQWKLTRSIMMPLTIKRLHNFSPHLSYVTTLPENMLTTIKLCCLPLIMCVALKRTSFGGSEKEPVEQRGQCSYDCAHFMVCCCLHVCLLYWSQILFSQQPVFARKFSHQLSGMCMLWGDGEYWSTSDPL